MPYFLLDKQSGFIVTQLENYIENRDPKIRAHCQNWQQETHSGQELQPVCSNRPLARNYSVILCQLYYGISFSNSLFEWGYFLLWFTFQRGKDSSQPAIKRLQHPLDHPLANLHILPSSSLTGSCKVVPDSSGIAKCLTQWQFFFLAVTLDQILCGIVSPGVPSPGSVVSRCCWTDSLSLGRLEASSVRERGFGLMATKLYVHTIHGLCRISAKTFEVNGRDTVGTKCFLWGLEWAETS